MQACLNCGETIIAGREYCNGHCAAAHRASQQRDRETDWFRCRLRQHLIAESWPASERLRRLRPDWRSPRASIQVLPSWAIAMRLRDQAGSS
jgi:hypothetical protein